MMRILESRAMTQMYRSKCKQICSVWSTKPCPGQDKASVGGVKEEMPYGKQYTVCRYTDRQSGSLRVPWDQTTHGFGVSIAGTPIAQRRMGFKATRAEYSEGVRPPTWLPTDSAWGVTNDCSTTRGRQWEQSWVRGTGFGRSISRIAQLPEVKFERSATVRCRLSLLTCLRSWLATFRVLTFVLLSVCLGSWWFEEVTPPPRVHGDSSTGGLRGNGAREKTALMPHPLWRSTCVFTTLDSRREYGHWHPCEDPFGLCHSRQLREASNS